MNYLPLIPIALGVIGIFTLKGWTRVVISFVLFTAGVVALILMHL